MAKAKTIIRLSAMRRRQSGFLGRCPSCGDWNSMVETIEDRRPARPVGARSGRPPERSRCRRLGPPRSTGSASRSKNSIGCSAAVWCRGSLVLIGGDPGIGKSTLVLQAASPWPAQVGTVLYVSAEESAQQIQLRADRLGVAPDDLWVLVRDESWSRYWRRPTSMRPGC